MKEGVDRWVGETGSRKGREEKAMKKGREIQKGKNKRKDEGQEEGMAKGRQAVSQAGRKESLSLRRLQASQARPLLYLISLSCALIPTDNCA